VIQENSKHIAEKVFLSSNGSSCHETKFNSKEELMAHWLTTSSAFPESEHCKLLYEYINLKRTLGEQVSLERCPSCGELSVLGIDQYSHRKVCKVLSQDVKDSMAVENLAKSVQDNGQTRADGLILKALLKNKSREEVEKILND
jgi:hypothetical protein